LASDALEPQRNSSGIAEYRIFLSHSSANNDQAVALYDWLQREGWRDEVFLDTRHFCVRF